MILGEAKEILRNESKYNESLNRASNELLKNENLNWNEPYLCNFEIDIDIRTKVNQAIDTALKALEDSIPKEKVRETLKECQNFIDEFENNEKDSIKKYKQLVNNYDVGLKQGVKAEIEMWKKNKMEYVHKRNILMELLRE